MTNLFNNLKSLVFVSIIPILLVAAFRVDVIKINKNVRKPAVISMMSKANAMKIEQLDSISEEH